MNKNEIVFTLNNTEKIIIQAEDSIKDIYCCYYVPTVFLSGTNTYKLSMCNPQDIADCLSKTLKKALLNQLIPHKSITKDIGFLWNEAYRDNPSLVYEGKGDLWVGDKLRIWEAGETGKELLSTWIYNDKNGLIILEITPDYPWYNCEPSEYNDYIPYEEWIKTYKPLVIRTISTDVAIKWIEQADAIFKQIEENIDRMQQEENSDQH